MLIALLAGLGPALAAASVDAGDDPPGARALLAAYPDRLAGFEDGALVWDDGTRMPWGEAAGDTGETRLDNASLAEQMAQPYPAGIDFSPPIPGEEPGRARCTAFFSKMYGATRAEVRSNLERVPWLRSRGTSRRSVLVTRLNGVSAALGKVVSELYDLEPKVRTVAARVRGGFAWRPVRGTSRPSAHSWGIAVDIGGARVDYWRWVRPLPDGSRPWRNRIPPAIVEVFERHGFIWGGKWHRFDTMHFEYRPELLAR